MANPKPRSNTLTHDQRSFVRANATALARLPEPDADPWPATKLDNDLRDAIGPLRILNERGIVSKAGIDDDPDDSDRRWQQLWTTTPGPYEEAQAHIADLDTLPCCPDGTGISTHAAPEGSYFDEKWYACRACGSAHTREIAAEVIR